MNCPFSVLERAPRPPFYGLEPARLGPEVVFTKPRFAIGGFGNPRKEAPTELPSRAGTKAAPGAAVAKIELHSRAGTKSGGPGNDDEEEMLGVPEELLAACFAADFGPILDAFAEDDTNIAGKQIMWISPLGGSG